MKGKITIKADIPEEVFMECMLNQHFSGQDISLMFGLYALANGWHINTFTYYAKLLEGLNDSK